MVQNFATNLSKSRIIEYFYKIDYVSKQSLMFVQNLTEFNTAHNRRITMLGISDEEMKAPNRKKKSINNVRFSYDEEIINPGKNC